MTQLPIDNLLEDALQMMATDFPEIKRKLDAFMKAAEHMDDRDESGNLTRAAHDARNLLRNPLLDMRPYRRAKSAVEKACRKSKFKAQTAINAALVAYVVWQQHALELDLLLDKDDASKEVPKSREVSDRHDKIRVTEKFVDELLERGVTPSDVSRKRKFEIDVIAGLLRWSQADQNFENPDNPWVKMSAAGMLEAYRSGMTDAEAEIINLAMVLRNEKGLQLLQAARDFLPQSLDVSPSFAAAAAQMMEDSSQLTPSEAQAYYDAHRHCVDQDLDALGKALGITDPDDLMRVKALNSFLRQYDWQPVDNIPIWLQATTIKQVVDSADMATRAPSDWVPEFTKKMAQLAEAFSERWDNETAFCAIMRAGLEMSSIGENYARISENKEEMSMRLSELNYLEALVLNGTAFKFGPDGCLISEDEEQYADFPGKVYRVLSDTNLPEGPANRDNISRGGEESLGSKVAPAEQSQSRESDDTFKPSACNLGELEENESTFTQPSFLLHQSDAITGGDEEAYECAGDLFATEKPYDSDELDETLHPISSTIVSADRVSIETDADGKKMLNSQPSTSILPTNAPQIAGLQMARRPSENAGSQDDGAADIEFADDAEHSEADSNNFKVDRAERTRAADMDDEDF